jgi:hypothetical protein
MFRAPVADARHDGTANALARYYDLDLEDDPTDIEMYRAFAAGGGSVLELMAGTAS